MFCPYVLVFCFFVLFCLFFLYFLFFVFFFKQKTAYEIYQCDWSSDVCSSDLYPRSTNYIEKTFVGIYNDKIVGSLIRGYDQHLDHITILFVGVHPDFKSLGVGKELIDELEGFAES